MPTRQTKEFTCVQCPMGCLLTVTLEDGAVVSVSGNSCPRGKAYGRTEAVHPERTVTSLVGILDDFHPLSVKTAAPIPRERIDEVLDAIAQTVIEPPVEIGDVVIPDVCGTGVDVVATEARS
ncbi:MAG: DUF1667 domain-containing protein [Atopobiaceae bacterium]|jgi:CxxC motif-containing protein|nr:DUF1667 domain-containing protein [Atopobiaceae bacterium]